MINTFLFQINMSFADQLQKQKMKLKGTDTIITNADGQRYIESKTNEKIVLSPNAYGFVVDNKPDNTPALITEHLYVGSQDCTAENVLVQHDIRHVLSLGVKVPLKIDYKYIDCLDLPEIDVRPLLGKSLPYLRDCVLLKQNVLVHCNAGVSRTSTVAIGYLMQYENMSFDEAHKLVKTKRPAVRPNDGFRKQLEQLKPGELI